MDSLFYQEKHMTCYHYSVPETAMFRVYRINQDSPPVNQEIDTPVLLFVMQGEVKVRLGTEATRRVEAGYFFLVPTFTRFRGICETSAEVIRCEFKEMPRFCDIYTIENLAQDTADRQNNNKTFFTLPIRGRLNEFFSLLAGCLDDGLQCQYYHEIKKKELFLLLSVYYSIEELSDLFRPILGTDFHFRQLILDNYKKIESVEQFAEIAHMTISTFQRKFKQAFRTPVKQWLLERKADSIIQDIKTTFNPIEEISYKYGFSSPSYFSNFCKRMFGKSPTELRSEKF